MMVLMARNWLASAELPSTFGFYALKRAVEVCNYFPYQLEDGTYTTPFELAHKTKPDLWVIFKMFGLAAVRWERIGDMKLSKFDSQSSPIIAVGCCPHSDGLQFYNPVNGTFVSSIDYKFQNHCTSGAKFGYQYQPGMFIYRLDETNSIFTPKFPLDSEVLVHTHSPPHVAKVVGIPSYDCPNVYTVLYPDGFYQLGFKKVLMQHCFYLLCPNLGMENCGYQLTIFGFSVQEIKVIFLTVSHCLTCRRIVNIFWTRVNSFEVTVNFVMSIMHVLNFNSRIVYSDMFPLMVSHNL
jgi:hypothetical protein